MLMTLGDIYPLHKLISRITQLLLVLSLFPLRRWLNLSWAEVGFAPKKQFFKQMATGFCLGFLTLLPVFAALYLLEVHVWDSHKIWTIAAIIKKTTLALLLAILISYVEEPVFRGVLLMGLRQKIGLWAAILLGSAYYGSLHFLETATLIPYPQITLGSGFRLFAEAIANWLNPAVLSAFAGLWMVGIFLAVLRCYIPQSLGLCMGFHASWVWQIKISKMFLNTNDHSPYLYLVSSYDGLVGPLIAAWLGLAILGYLTYQWRHQP